MVLIGLDNPLPRKKARPITAGEISTIRLYCLGSEFCEHLARVYGAADWRLRLRAGRDWALVWFVTNGKSAFAVCDKNAAKSKDYQAIGLTTAKRAAKSNAPLWRIQEFLKGLLP